MSYTIKNLFVAFLLSCVAGNAVAQLSPTGRPQSRGQTTMSLTRETAKATKATGLGGFNVGVSHINFGNSNVTLGNIQDNIELQPGTAYDLLVPINKNGYSGNLYFASVFDTFQDGVAANGTLLATVQPPSNQSFPNSVVYVRINASITAVPGTQIDFRLMGHEVGSNKKIAERHFTVTIAEAQNSYAYLELSMYEDMIPQYASEGFANTAFAMYDANSNGVVDSAPGNNYAAFPAEPSLFGTTQGRGYANPYGDQANLIVAGTFDDGQVFSVHLKVVGDSIYPIMAMVGDISTGELLVQDATGWDFQFEGEFPSNGQSGFIEGNIQFTPIRYHGGLNLIYGNTVSIDFDVELVPDA